MNARAPVKNTTLCGPSVTAPPAHLMSAGSTESLCSNSRLDLAAVEVCELELALTYATSEGSEAFTPMRTSIGTLMSELTVSMSPNLHSTKIEHQNI